MPRWPLGATMIRFLGHLRLTAAIPMLAIGGVTLALLAMLAGMFVSVSTGLDAQAERDLKGAMRIAGAILQVNLPSLVVETDEAGDVTGLSARSMPRFRTHDVIDAVARVAGAPVSVYVYNPEAGPNLTMGSTSITDATGERVMTTEIAADSSLGAALLAGQAVTHAALIGDLGYHQVVQPIMTADGVLIGALEVGVPDPAMPQVMAALSTPLLIGLVVLAVASFVVMLAARVLVRPIPRLAGVMSSLAGGELHQDVPYLTLGNEVGSMARAVEVFRTTGLEKQALDAQSRQQLAEAADHTGQLHAISRSQIVVEFDLEGRVLGANDNFLSLLGYRAEDVVGQANALFLFDADPNSATYRQFWSDLAEGHFKSGEYRRKTRSGQEVWIQSTFTPISDPEGNPYKVVQFATDVTARKQAVAAVGAGLQALAAGDLTARLDQPFPAEFEDLRTALNGTVARFAEVIGQLRQTARALRTASRELLSGANDLSDRTSRQAATIEQTSATMEELAGTVVRNAGMAEEAADKASAVSDVAARSGAVMEDATAAMDRITQSSAKISNIIGLIDDIAFQTNLLALNASVEAARAGEAGKGFAVVAVEVRRLAQSAAQASSEVKALVDQSGHEVREGARLVGSAGESLAAMLDAVRVNTELVRSIAQASRMQAASIEEVTAAVRQLDEMTQHNAALVEETNAVIEQTEGQTRTLDDVVDIFRLEDGAEEEAGPVRRSRAA